MTVRQEIVSRVRYFALAAAAGAMGTFVIAIGFQILRHLWSSAALETTTASISQYSEFAAAACYLALSTLYLLNMTAADTNRHVHRLIAVAYVSTAMTILLGTGGLYGLLISIRELFPALPRFDALQVACLAMSVLLLAAMIVRRLQR